MATLDSAAPGALVVATWMHADGIGDESWYPQVDGLSSAPAFQNVYWRCIAVFFAVSVRQNAAGTRHRLYTNLSRLPVVDGLNLETFLARLGVEVVTRPFTYAPPKGYHPAWRNQFYVFDALSHLAETTGDNDAIVLLDSDIVWARSGESLQVEIARRGALAYALGFGDDHVENGLSARDSGQIGAELDPVLGDRPIPYCGGEVVAVRGDVLRLLTADVPAVWREMMGRFGRGAPYFREEAHLLSFLYRRHGIVPGTANPYLRRIWTTLLRDSPLASDIDLTLWHVPSEKRYGLKRLFDIVAEPESRFWTLEPGAPLRGLLARELGIPRRSLRKWMRDLPEAVAYKLEQRLGRRMG